ncbi:MAG: glycoside hydrolase family 9 protein [Anaerolineae bacterium]
MREPYWSLNEHGYFEAPGLSALFFHNGYPEGKQGGIEVIQHGERTLTCGDLRLATAPGQWDVRPETGEREIEGEAAVVTNRFAEAELAYTVRLEPDGEALCVTVNLEEPLPPEAAGKVGFNLEIYPGAYFGKAFRIGEVDQTDAVEAWFPRQFDGPTVAGPEGGHRPVPLANGARFIAAPEDPLRRFEVVSESGTIALFDGRVNAQNGWFVLRELVLPGATERAVVWRITVSGLPGWRRDPVIAVSQVGYHPDQDKRAVIELDARTEAVEEAALERIEAAGPIAVHTAKPEHWGRFLRYTYAIFDFSQVTERGLYRIRYGDHVSSPFKIHPHVYRHDVWQPTLETFFPVQMCHVAVKDRYQTWHGACHLDDAMQAPSPHEHFDGYRQYEDSDTDFEPYEHIPYLDQGGWHDAGDYDLAAGSQARTTHTLALIRELFGVDTDQTTVDWEAQTVLLHTPDGVPDIVEQVAHGAQCLLGGYRAAGHSFQGIIANSLEQYVHLGDASTMTDNRIYDPELALEEVEETPVGAFSGEMDDRWAFTNHDTALEYAVAAALAAASRVLDEFMPGLATECLATAVQIWDYEQAHEPVEQRGAYVPRGAEIQEILAAVELLLTTGERPYRERLLALWPTIEETAMWVSGAVARALDAINDEAFRQAFREIMVEGLPQFTTQVGNNPFGIVFDPHIWGIGWQLLGYATQLYQLRLAFPDLIDRELILRALNYSLGCHPASSTSLVSGVGASSVTAAYGINRDDWSYVPGGVISGPALIRPDFPELKEPWPFLWQQTEYVISGAANYIFCVLAADRMLNG